MARTSNRPFQAVCPTVEEAFDLLARKWAGLVIHCLAGGPLHFSELEHAIAGVSSRMLAERLKELEHAGVVTRTVETGIPVRTLYELSDKGRALVPVMKGIERWAQAWGASSGR